MMNPHKYHNYFMFLLLLLRLNKVSVGSRSCNPRQFGNNISVVCVCNESYCDTFDPISRTAIGVVQIFQSTRSGKRFSYHKQQFSEGRRLPGNHWLVKIEHNSAERMQEIFGFGGAFSDAAALTIGSLSEKVQRDLLGSYYNSSGIEYSIGRAVIAGSDFSVRPYTYDDTPNDWNLVNFKLMDEDTSYKIPQIKMASEMASHGFKLISSSWSPPAWLKTNGELIHVGQLKGDAGSVYWKTYAKYLVKYFQSYQDEGIDFWGMTIQNEPGITNTSFPWNTCSFTPEMESAFVKTDLGPELEQAGFSPHNFTIMCLDHNRDFLPDWVMSSYGDPEVSRWIKGTAVHWYGNDAAPVTVYDETHTKFPDKFILATEACASGPVGDKAGIGNWTVGEMYAHDILRDLTHWVIGWVDWNLAVDMEGGPNWVGNYQSAPIIVNAESNEFYKNPSFYALGHFSKFLPPGSRRIRTDPELNDNDRFQTGAFIRPDGAHVVISVNSWDESQVVTIVDSARGEVEINAEPHSFNTYLYY